MTTTPRGDLADVEASLSSALGAGAVSTAPDELDGVRRRHVLAGAGRKGRRDAAGAPRRRRTATDRGGSRRPCSRSPTSTASPVVPWGGGSGTQGGALAIHGGIVIDLRSLDEVIEVDETSLTVTVQAGKNGRELEAELNARGLMLPHYPASVEWATVGGYIAARGSGVLSTRYGKIEDLRAVAAGGHAGRRADGHRRRPAPRRRARADAAVRRLGGHARRDHARHARSSCRCPRSAASPPSPSRRVSAGIGAIRRALQVGHRPSVVRMYDEEATRLAFAPVVGEELSGVYTVLAFEGEAEAARARGAAHARDRARGGRRAARPGARAALVGPPLRLLPPAPPARAARDLGHARRGRDLRAHRGGLRRAAHRGPRALPRRRAPAADALLALVRVGHDDLRPLRRPRRRAGRARAARPDLGGRHDRRARRRRGDERPPRGRASSSAPTCAASTAPRSTRCARSRRRSTPTT